MIYVICRQKNLVAKSPEDSSHLRPGHDVQLLGEDFHHSVLGHLVEEAEANVSRLLLVQLRNEVRHRVERDLCARELSLLGLLARALGLLWPCLGRAVSEGSG